MNQHMDRTAAGPQPQQPREVESAGTFLHRRSTFNGPAPELFRKAQPRVKSETALDPPTRLRRAVFLDRDGVLNRALVKDGKPYPPARLEEFEILDGVPEACGRLRAAGLLLVVVTNQPDVGRGTMKREMVEAMHAHMCQRLPIDRVEVSYDSGQEVPPSEFRKPRPGMLLRAAGELGIDLSRSFMVGDRWRDIDCGHAAGCTTFLIDYGYQEALRHPPDFRAKDLRECADQILMICGGTS